MKILPNGASAKTLPSARSVMRRNGSRPNQLPVAGLKLFA